MCNSHFLSLFGGLPRGLFLMALISSSQAAASFLDLFRSAFFSSSFVGAACSFFFSSSRYPFRPSTTWDMGMPSSANTSSSLRCFLGSGSCSGGCFPVMMSTRASSWAGWSSPRLACALSTSRSLWSQSGSGISPSCFSNEKIRFSAEKVGFSA